MDDSQYAILKKISKLGQIKSDMFPDDSIKFKMLNADLIERFPTTDILRMSRNGERLYKKELWNCRGKWWLRNWPWILAIVGAILTAIKLFGGPHVDT